MALRFVGIDPNTGGGNCPTVWVDEETSDLIVQGWKVDELTLQDCLKTGAIPETEAVVRIPLRMVSLVKEACDVAERTQL